MHIDFHEFICTSSLTATQFEQFYKSNVKAKWSWFTKCVTTYFFFFLFSLIKSMIVQKAAWGTSQRQKEPANKDKLCHIILGWPLLSICHKEGNFGPKQFYWPRHPHRALPFQAVLSSQCLSLAIQDPLFPFSANFHFLKQIPSFILELRFPSSLPRNLSERCFYLWRNVPVQEANTHQSNIDSGLFKCANPKRRCGMVEGLSELQRHGAKISLLPIARFYNLCQSHLYSLSLNLFFCRMAIIISARLNNFNHDDWTR